MDFVEALRIAEQGFDAWKAQPHNARWFRKIDGTPIPNDLLVTIAMEFVAATSTPPLASPAGGAAPSSGPG